ncbi:MAG: asparaginase [Cytophagales bacterium]|nr:MAG: asparaginase [Cytophagales bacterium]TAF59508.1 MAG: asparaginase [Cytophagales bacterium]
MKNSYYEYFDLLTAGGASPESSILIIYTGGTIGMDTNADGALVPLDFERILEKLPELRRFRYRLRLIAPFLPLDSSNVGIAEWLILSEVIASHYHEFDAFVVLHGTDTMAYTASALSFLLDGLQKPVIFTGSQIPIGFTRTDARENFISALEIAASQTNGQATVPEVCICFSSVLLRANRSSKVATSNFTAFASENYPPLARIGIQLDFNYSHILKRHQTIFKAHKNLDNRVTIMKFYPSMMPDLVKARLQNQTLRGVVLESYGSGNLPTSPWLQDAISEAAARGVVFLNISQCMGGAVAQGKYEASTMLNELGVVSGHDMTTEAAITKLMFVLGQTTDSKEAKQLLRTSLCGELSL